MRIKYNWIFFCVILSFTACQFSTTESSISELANKDVRQMRYHPDGGDFVITNGTHRFNRALYGGNTGFRVEAGDLPEFAMYMPRVGGTMRLGIIQNDSSKWLIDAKHIEARYRGGSMLYTITDPILNNGSLELNLQALQDADGFILKVNHDNIPSGVHLFVTFGGANGKRFSRDGDLGADPESVFYLTDEKCVGNEYFLDENYFNLFYSSRSSKDPVFNPSFKSVYTLNEKQNSRLKEKKRICGVLPQGVQLSLKSAKNQKNPISILTSKVDSFPVVSASIELTSHKEPFYFLLINPDSKPKPQYSELESIFNHADSLRSNKVNRFTIETPDAHINAVGHALTTAADAVWDGESFMHGAIAWRMPLNGWRGAYAADWLGWHDRAKTHFRGYFKSQYTEAANRPSEPNPKTHLARQKEEQGTDLFSDGYISRRPGKINKPHHYDMNLVFIEQLLWHFKWTGDLDFLKESWPVIKRHLAWEKRNFDANDDGLYDAYCCIWASDALQYSGGGVTHSSAYNYNANIMAAELAGYLNEDATSYLKEAHKIKEAVNKHLWLQDKGWFAEYKDLLGEQLVHPSAALWTIYHAIDEGLADPFQAYQSTQYVSHSIPHIPVDVEGMPMGQYYTLSTTNWMPYTWSINNVALAEVLHTSLAHWQASRKNEAYTLMKSSFMDYMFAGTCPGNFGQLSYYDVFRGELYRDFADPIGMASRVFVEGLFGISPNLFNNQVTIKPGWPSEWNFANLETPDFKVNYNSEGLNDHYTINTHLGKEINLNLVLGAKTDRVKSVKVNGVDVSWTSVSDAIGDPQLKLVTERDTAFQIDVCWQGEEVEHVHIAKTIALGEYFQLTTDQANVVEIYDPQNVLSDVEISKKRMSAVVVGELGWRTLFVKMNQGEMTWWEPLTLELKEAVEFVIESTMNSKSISCRIRNNTAKEIAGSFEFNGFSKKVNVDQKSLGYSIDIPSKYYVAGSSQMRLVTDKESFQKNSIHWGVKASNKVKYESVALSEYFNDKVTNIFSEQYLSPRSPYPTLSIPIQGIGDWCSYKEHEEIDDTGIRAVASKNGGVVSPQNIPFEISSTEEKNILFTSKWDVYPDSLIVPISGKARHLYLLMAGSGHHMQIHMTNGEVEVEYTDGSVDRLPLVSPENWWPIEQDYYQNGLAFNVNAPQPPRLYLKTGEWHMDSYDVLKKNGTNKIEGGAASLLDLPLDPLKELKSLKLITHTNDVVIGIMAITFQRI